MKRIFATLLAVALTAAIAGDVRAAAPKSSGKKANASGACANPRSKYQRAQCANFVHSAPGDEYFGRMKLSYLGINNTFRDEAVRAGGYTTDPAIISRVQFADEALRAWSSKYPGDPQLPRSYFLGVEVMRKIYTQPIQDRAWQIMQILTKQFARSYFGKIMAKSLKIGFTKHYFAVPLPCPTPLPTGVRSTPRPAPSPIPSPTPMPAPNQPKIVVIVPPCVAVTPSPPPPVVPTATPPSSHSPSARP